ncbi:MAG: VapB-type antitoxin [Thermoprotei archaeon]|nr:VapB-type antitoxin [Thermoprotei archaeon]
MSDIISVRVPKELREKMKKFSYINWSEVIREAIKKRIEIEEKKQRKMKAAEDMDRIRNKILRLYGITDYDSSEVIRYWRELRK